MRYLLLLLSLNACATLKQDSSESPGQMMHMTFVNVCSTHSFEEYNKIVFYKTCEDK